MTRRTCQDNSVIYLASGLEDSPHPSKYSTLSPFLPFQPSTAIVIIIQVTIVVVIVIRIAMVVVTATVMVRVKIIIRMI